MALRLDGQDQVQVQARGPLQLNQNNVNLRFDQQSHVCTRFCNFSQVFGNVFQCSTSGSMHVCDDNCGQQIFFDNHNVICRLSRRLFPRQSASATR